MKIDDKEREKRFEVIDRIRASVPEYPEAEVEADIAEAIAHVRKIKRQESEAEMGGESPCQLHRFWDVEE
jgi:hypothetical protein